MDALTQFELSVNIFLQSLGSWLTPLMLVVTNLGGEYFYIFLLTAIYWCLDTTIGLRIGIILMLSNSSNFILKLLLHSPRPYWIDPRVKALSTETSFGLPSGHSQHAMSIWGTLAVNLKRKTGWLAGLIILLMGISRMYLGVHFLRDVLLGWLTGAVLVVLLIYLEKPLVAWFTRQHLAYRLAFALLTALVMIAAGMAVRAADAGWTLPPAWIAAAQQAAPDQPFDPLAFDGLFTSAGTWFGMLAGAALLAGGRGGHDVRGPVNQRILRLLLGLTGLLALYFGLGAIFPRTPDLLGYSLRFVRYALIGFWAIWLAPYLFVKTGLARARGAV